MFEVHIMDHTQHEYHVEKIQKYFKSNPELLAILHDIQNALSNHISIPTKKSSNNPIKGNIIMNTRDNTIEILFNEYLLVLERLKWGEYSRSRSVSHY
jgi:hypothetical protein